MEYDNTNRGAIWQNTKKTTDKHPDFRGELNVNGVDYWISAWKRKPGDNPNSPSLRFAVQPKEEKQPAQPTPDQAPFTDDIPF